MVSTFGTQTCQWFPHLDPKCVNGFHIWSPNVSMVSTFGAQTCQWCPKLFQCKGRFWFWFLILIFDCDFLFWFLILIFDFDDGRLFLNLIHMWIRTKSFFMYWSIHLSRRYTFLLVLYYWYWKYSVNSIDWLCWNHNVAMKNILNNHLIHFCKIQKLITKYV